MTQHRDISERTQSKTSKGKRHKGKVQRTSKNFPPARSQKTCLIPPATNVTTAAKCCLPRKLRDSSMQVLLEAGHIGTLCPAQNTILDSQRTGVLHKPFYLHSLDSLSLHYDLGKSYQCRNSLISQAPRCQPRASLKNRPFSNSSLGPGYVNIFLHRQNKM